MPREAMDPNQPVNFGQRMLSSGAFNQRGVYQWLLVLMALWMEPLSLEPLNFYMAFAEKGGRVITFMPHL